MIFIERYPLKRYQGCVKLIASKVNCFLNINDLSEVQLCMSSNSWTWECPHTKDGADHVPLIFLSSVYVRMYNGNSGRQKKRIVAILLSVSWTIGHCLLDNVFLPGNARPWSGRTGTCMTDGPWIMDLCVINVKMLCQKWRNHHLELTSDGEYRLFAFEISFFILQILRQEFRPQKY